MVPDVADSPIPCKTDEAIAANKEGRRNWKITLLESITPASLTFLLSRVWEREERKPTVNPIAVAAPGL